LIIGGQSAETLFENPATMQFVHHVFRQNRKEDFAFLRLPSIKRRFVKFFRRFSKMKRRFIKLFARGCLSILCKE